MPEDGPREDGSTDALLDALSRHQEFEGFIARACSSEREAATLLTEAVIENGRYAAAVEGFGQIVGVLVKAVRHPYPGANGGLELLTGLLGDEGFGPRRAIETYPPGLVVTLHLSCDLFGAPVGQIPPYRPPRRFFEVLWGRHRGPGPELSAYDGQRLDEARRIVLLRSAPYLAVPGGEYVVLQRLLALDDPMAPDRRLGLPRWALRALFGIRSTVVVETEGTVSVVSLVLRAEAGD